MRDVVQIPMFQAYPFVIGALPIVIPVGTSEFVGQGVTHRTTTIPAPESSNWVSAYLSGYVNTPAPGCFLQLRYSSDGGTTWWNTPHKLDLSTTKDVNGNIDVLPVNCTNRNPVQFMLDVVNPGATPLEGEFLFHVDLTIYSV